MLIVDKGQVPELCLRLFYVPEPTNKRLLLSKGYVRIVDLEACYHVIVSRVFLHSSVFSVLVEDPGVSEELGSFKVRPITQWVQVQLGVDEEHAGVFNVSMVEAVGEGH